MHTPAKRDDTMHTIMKHENNFLIPPPLTYLLNKCALKWPPPRLFDCLYENEGEEDNYHILKEIRRRCFCFCYYYYI